MSGSFGGIYISSSGLYSSQAALNVTSSNISNADVEGYTRQQVMQTDLSPNYTDQTLYGGGTSISEIRHIRSAYLDASYREENSSLGYWQTTSSALTHIENSLSYSEENSLFNTSEEFFNAWEEASKSPDDASARVNVTQQGALMVETFDQLSKDLIALTDQIQTEITNTVDTINSISASINDLNKAIKIATSLGTNSTLLEDERNQLLDELSTYGDVNILEKSDGSIDVYFGNQTLINDSGNRTLSHTSLADGSTSLVWEDNGYPLELNTGTLKSLQDLTQTYTGPVPAFESDTIGFLSAYEQTLDYYATILVDEVNAIHSSSIDLDGGTGNAFFIAVDSDEPIGLSNIQVNPLLDDHTNLALSESGLSGDGSAASQISNLKDTALLSDGASSITFEQYCSQLTEWTGFTLQSATTHSETQNAVVYQLSNERLSVMAVSLDEEMNNMIMYQQSYNANAAVIDVLDQLLEQVINQM